MKIGMLAVALSVLALCPAGAQAPKSLRIAFAGIAPLTTPFYESLQNAGQEVGLSFEVVPFSNKDRNYLIAVSQVGTVANAVIAIDQQSGAVAACVAGSGMFLKNDIKDISAKELVRQLAAITK